MDKLSPEQRHKNMQAIKNKDSDIEKLLRKELWSRGMRYRNREIKRRTKAIGAFPDGQSALMLVCARLRHVAASDWGTKRYLNMDHLFQMELMNNTETAETSTG